MPRPVLLAAAILLAAPPAHAHLMSTGFGPFYDGLTHLFVTPEDLLLMIGVGLLAGLAGVAPARAAVFSLPAAWLAGSVVGALLGAPATGAAPAAVATIAVGGLVAAGAPLPAWAITTVAVAIGLLAGGQNGAELAAAHASTLVAAGAACALFVTLSLLGGQVTAVRASWARVVVRVGGSWIAAIGLLMLGWSLRPA
jgi:urease accessory protein